MTEKSLDCRIHRQKSHLLVSMVLDVLHGKMFWDFLGFWPL